MHNPFVPETLDGWSVLHLMYRVRWERLRDRTPADRERLAAEAARALAVPDAGSTGMVQDLGHKDDLMGSCFLRGFAYGRQARGSDPAATSSRRPSTWKWTPSGSVS